MNRHPFDAGRFEDHHRVQQIAKSVLALLSCEIQPTDSEESIAHLAVKLLADNGITETWYYHCPALVLAGPRSVLSNSGRSYQPDPTPLGEANLFNVDLSPLLNGSWGDCARTFFIEDGRCVSVTENPEYRRGLEVELLLHAQLRRVAAPEMTFAELFEASNGWIAVQGFENLDGNNNFGHSVESRLEDRRYIEAGNQALLGEVDFFTFEPHIRPQGAAQGFKHENIYFFAPNGRLEEL